mmetsp:Transcript_77664/g.222581  ORF Transcript_77664/g.222581 Transcript_77664/m.222581 type:complete len:279 (+) Transcript_77664:601-1437(+)
MHPWLVAQDHGGDVLLEVVEGLESSTRDDERLGERPLGARRERRELRHRGQLHRRGLVSDLALEVVERELVPRHGAHELAPDLGRLGDDLLRLTIHWRRFFQHVLRRDGCCILVWAVDEAHHQAQVALAQPDLDGGGRISQHARQRADLALLKRRVDVRGAHTNVEASAARVRPEGLLRRRQPGVGAVETAAQPDLAEGQAPVAYGEQHLRVLHARPLHRLVDGRSDVCVAVRQRLQHLDRLHARCAALVDTRLACGFVAPVVHVEIVFHPVPKLQRL